MRWLTTKTLFTLWHALMWGVEDDRRLFLRLLSPVVDHMQETAHAELEILLEKRKTRARKEGQA